MPPVQKRSFAHTINDHALFLQTAFALYESGSLGIENYSPYLTWFACQVATPGGSAWWREAQGFYNEALVESVDGRLAEGAFPTSALSASTRSGRSHSRMVPVRTMSTSTQVAGMSISERRTSVAHEGHSDIPCSIWSATERPRGVVLLGHGLGVDRYDVTVRVPMELLALEHEVAVVVPEIPLHGVRDELPHDPSGVVRRWQEFWIAGGARTISEELQSLVRFCEESYGALPVAYFGLSLGTQYGLPFLARTSSVRSAVLGLFGSQPPPRTPLMNRYAPAVRCPVYFIQKLDDEVHPAESTTHLFSTLGSVDKVLDSTPGKHTETTMESLRKACAFLARHAQWARDSEA